MAIMSFATFAKNDPKNFLRTFDSAAQWCHHGNELMRDYFGYDASQYLNFARFSAVLHGADQIFVITEAFAHIQDFFNALADWGSAEAFLNPTPPPEGASEELIAQHDQQVQALAAASARDIRKYQAQEKDGLLKTVGMGFKLIGDGMALCLFAAKSGIVPGMDSTTSNILKIGKDGFSGVGTGMEMINNLSIYYEYHDGRGRAVDLTLQLRELNENAILWKEFRDMAVVLIKLIGILGALQALGLFVFPIPSLILLICATLASVGSFGHIMAKDAVANYRAD